MSGRVKTQLVVEACNAGIEKAYYTYLNMTGGHWLWYAPEYFITTMIALELHNVVGSKYITLENSTHDALSYSGAIGKGKLHQEIRANGRVDILLWWGNGSPRAIIEVKNRLYNINQYADDIKRIKGMLNRKVADSSLEFGIFSFYTESKNSEKNNAENSLDRKLKTIETNIADILGADFYFEFNTTATHSEDDNSWCAVSVLIKRL
jgi:hypothetical protein